MVSRVSFCAHCLPKWLSDLPLNTFSPFFIKLEVQLECFLQVCERKK